MDQNTQTTTNGTTPITPPQAEQVIMGGAFGGTIPATQEAISETMPSFSFDEAEFGGPVQPVAETQQTLLNDPFAGGATSTNISLDDLNQTPSIPEATIVESSPLENVVPDTIESVVPLNPMSDSSVSNGDFNISAESASEWVPSFDLPPATESFDSPILEIPTNEATVATPDISFDLPEEQVPVVTQEEVSLDIPQDSNNLNEISFDLPVSTTEQPSEAPLENAPENISQNELSDISFDLPVSTTEQALEAPLENQSSELYVDSDPLQNLQWESSSTDTLASLEVTPPTLEQATLDSDFSLPSNDEEVSSEENPIVENFETVVPTSDDNNSNETSVMNEETINEEDHKKQSDLEEVQEDKQEVEESADDTVIAETTKEEWTDNTHALQETFDEFSSTLNGYLSFLNTDTVTMIGLRTDEDEVQYTFTKEYDDTITIAKSNTGDLITFTPTESGLEVFLNKESIAYYGVDEVYHDTTHYLKEKLGKFTMMIESEHEKQAKAKKDEAKKVKETLRSF